MRVKHLIKKLSKLDPSLMVVARGYEAGYEEVTELELISLIDEGPDHSWYYGRFEEAGYSYKKDGALVASVHLS